MGLFDRAKRAMGGGADDAGAGSGAGAAGGFPGMDGDWAAQAQAAQQFAAAEFAKAGYGDGIPTAADISGGLGSQMMSDRDELTAYGQELNRIYQIGERGTGVITGSVDTSERTAGQAWFQIETLITLPGQAPFSVSKREMVPDSALEKYAVGTSHDVRVDPADQQKFCFAS